MFPIHPIDAVIVPEAGEEPRADANDTICVGAFSYTAPNYVGKRPCILCPVCVLVDVC